jgi:tRNA G46 methylase TrmB
MPEASLRAWVELIGSFTPAPAPAVVEIGAGTGMFCAALARWRQASLVVGVDPSVAMLAQAGRFTPYLDRSGVSQRVNGEPFLAPGVASVPA